MKRLAFLGVGSAVILATGVMGAAPAFADNGPHVATTGQFAVDRCAGCHRAHTGAFANLLTKDPTLLCQSCHGSGSTGATTDVVEGILLQADAGDPTKRANPKTTVGALRAGGFSSAAIDGATGAWSTTSSSTAVKSVKTVFAVGGGGAPTTSTSAHQINSAGTMWGSGALGSVSAGASVTLECTSCHDPHGNGNYRILKPTISTTDIAAANGGWSFTKAQATTITSATAGSASSRGIPYTIVATVANGALFKITDPVTFYASTGTDGFINGNVTDVTGNTVTISYTLPTSSVSASWPTAPAAADTGIMAYANPAGIASVSISGSVVTYKTWSLHGLYSTAKVTMTGFTGTGATANNVTRAAVTVTDPVTFTIDFSAQTPAITAPTASPTAMGAISGIPDAKSKVYTTDNYWAADDHNYTGSLVNGTLTALNANDTAANKGPTAFIGNISQWCTQCHTRLLAGSGAYEEDSGDPMFTFRHRSQSAKENSPNCIQCHVAHGSNASMQGDGKTSYSKTDVQGELGVSSGDSFLLRADNRGTCQMCHNK